MAIPEPGDSNITNEWMVNNIVPGTRFVLREFTHIGIDAKVNNLEDCQLVGIAPDPEPLLTWPPQTTSTDRTSAASSRSSSRVARIDASRCLGPRLLTPLRW